MKLEISTIVVILMVLVFALWMDTSRQRLTMKKVDRHIFDGVKGG